MGKGRLFPVSTGKGKATQVGCTKTPHVNVGCPRKLTLLVALYLLTVKFCFKFQSRKAERLDSTSATNIKSSVGLRALLHFYFRNSVVL